MEQTPCTAAGEWLADQATSAQVDLDKLRAMRDLTECFLAGLRTTVETAEARAAVNAYIRAKIGKTPIADAPATEVYYEEDE